MTIQTCLDREGPAPGVPLDIDALRALDRRARRPRHLACRACGRAVTSDDARIEVAGAHEHTRENPAGIVFRIGCFRAAPGALSLGPEVSEHTWFPGRTWQIALCRGCHTHLGWAFRSSHDRFHGLILDALREDDSPPG